MPDPSTTADGHVVAVLVPKGTDTDALVLAMEKILARARVPRQVQVQDDALLIALEGLQGRAAERAVKYVIGLARDAGYEAGLYLG